MRCSHRQEPLDEEDEEAGSGTIQAEVARRPSIKTPLEKRSNANSNEET
jgi:hypothetical protein